MGIIDSSVRGVATDVWMLAKQQRGEARELLLGGKADFRAAISALDGFSLAAFDVRKLETAEELATLGAAKLMQGTDMQWSLPLNDALASVRSLRAGREHAMAEGIGDLYAPRAVDAVDTARAYLGGLAR